MSLVFFIFVLGRLLRLPKKCGCLEISFRLYPVREIFTALLVHFLTALLPKLLPEIPEHAFSVLTSAWECQGITESPPSCLTGSCNTQITPFNSVFLTKTKQNKTTERKQILFNKSLRPVSLILNPVL